MCLARKDTHEMPERSEPGDAGAGGRPRRCAGVARRNHTDASEER